MKEKHFQLLNLSAAEPQRGINMSITLHPMLETLLLLAGGNWEQQKRGSLIKEFSDLGLDGEIFYNRHFNMAEKYFAAFQKQKIQSEGSRILEEMKDNTLLLGFVLHIFWKYSGCFEDGKEISEGVFHVEFEHFLNAAAKIRGGGYLEQGEDMIELLNQFGLSVEFKWQIMVFVHHYKKQFDWIGAAVRENLGAFNNAYKKVAGEVEPLLNQLETLFSDSNENGMFTVWQKAAPDAAVVAVLACPLSVIMLEEVIFYGVLADKVGNGMGSFTREELMAGAKVLSEKSKLDILFALKDTALYSTEIADRVGVTLATISHHMNLLMAAGFVTMERRDGKVYYQLASQGIRRFVEGVVLLLL